MLTRTLGRHGPTACALGLGCMGMSDAYGLADFRAHDPRWQGVNGLANHVLADCLAALAVAHRTTAAVLATAWLLTLGGDVVPRVGARRRDRLTAGLGALKLTLTPTDLAEIWATVPASAVAGTRYDAAGMAMLDSERPAA